MAMETMLMTIINNDDESDNNVDNDNDDDYDDDRPFSCEGGPDKFITSIDLFFRPWQGKVVLGE